MPKKEGVLYQNKMKVINDRVMETECVSMKTFFEHFLDSSLGIAFYRNLAKLKRADYQLLLECLEYEPLKNRDEEDRDDTECNLGWNRGTEDESRVLGETLFKELKLDNPDSKHLDWWLYFQTRCSHIRSGDYFIPLIQNILQHAKNI